MAVHRNVKQALTYILNPDKTDDRVLTISLNCMTEPELAHKIGMAFVRKMFGDDVQAVIATHVNTDQVHNHILINAYSLTGKRFYDNKSSVRKMREITNGVCRAFGITPALNFENEGRSLNYSEGQHKKKGTSWKEHIRRECHSDY